MESKGYTMINDNLKFMNFVKQTDPEYPKSTTHKKMTPQNFLEELANMHGIDLLWLVKFRMH